MKQIDRRNVLIVGATVAAGTTLAACSSGGSGMTGEPVESPTADPGSASTVGSIRVLGAGSDSSIDACAGLSARVNIFVRVASSTWISRPTMRPTDRIMATG